MTDEAYVLKETNRERAILKRSACHKVSGRKSKMCKLGVEYMTNKEINKLHGPIETYDLNYFYTFNEFKNMPNDIQVEYVNHLMTKYNVGIATISQYAFEMSHGYLAIYLQRKKLLNSIIAHTRRGRFMSEKNLEAFKAAIDLQRKDVEPMEENTCEIIEVPEEYVPPIPVEAVKQTVTSKTFSTTYIADKIDIDSLYLIQQMFKDNKIQVSITIETV